MNRKSENRMSKSETNPKNKNPKPLSVAQNYLSGMCNNLAKLLGSTASLEFRVLFHFVWARNNQSP
ncbi:MAG: hypothetical protein NTV79_04960, partial [Candidatus Aureabacteria bacterium]|nr:hypothetical protein [Candidatus Auribacterota bacterium]